MSALAIDTNVDHISNKSGSSIIFGRFMLPDMTEHACQVLDVSPQGATFITATVPAANGSRLERLQQRIEWLRQKNDGAVEARRHPRFEPKDKHSSITLPDGRVYNCEVVDISVSGAAIRTDVLPSVGTYVMLGKMKGRVVRYLDNGVAIEFVKQLDKTDLVRSVA